jgi:putative hydrolase of the HAD superfamily
MKPHPSIFEAALKLAGVSASDALMVGDSLTQDIDGARRVGMRGVLVRRSELIANPRETDVPVIRSLVELGGMV